jgi:hypothetical protein
MVRTILMGRDIRLDRPWVNIHFKNCQLVFDASAPLQMANCVLDATPIVFAGAAERTVEALRAMHSAGGEVQKAVEEVIRLIRTPPMSAATRRSAVVPRTTAFRSISGTLDEQIGRSGQ